MNETLDISNGFGIEYFSICKFPFAVINKFLSFTRIAGYPSWRLAFCLFGSWAIVFLLISRGIKSSGKASYFLALFPYVIIFALLIRAVTLEGAWKGILYFLTPQWHELLNPKVCTHFLFRYILLEKSKIGDQNSYV